MLKPVPVLCLGLWVLAAPKSSYRNRIAIGLGLSLAGDVLIEWSFIAGLVAFLLAHVAYTAAFLSDTTRPCLIRALPVAAYAVGLTTLLWPGLGNLRPAFLAYALAIGTMLWRAAARVGHGGAATPGEWAALAGAILFALSDSLIAVHRFFRSCGVDPHSLIVRECCALPGSPIPWASVPIMILYWAGQLGIAWSAKSR